MRISRTATATFRGFRSDLASGRHVGPLIRRSPIELAGSTSRITMPHDVVGMAFSRRGQLLLVFIFTVARFASYLNSKCIEDAIHLILCGCGRHGPFLSSACFKYAGLALSGLSLRF